MSMYNILEETMSLTREKRELIKRQLVEMINNDDKDFAPKLMESYGITLTSVRRYIDTPLNNNIIIKSSNKDCGYELVWMEKSYVYNIKDTALEEHEIYADILAPVITHCSQQACLIWPYVFVEIMNNAIEHSGGNKIICKIRKSFLFTDVIIADNGLGIFKRIKDYVKSENDININTKDIIMELHKGKLTIAKYLHSGEGIFFVSKMLDYFAICSDNQVFYKGDSDDSSLKDYLESYAGKISGHGTTVWMELSNFTTKSMQEVFNEFSTDKEGFAKTTIPIYDICTGGYPVARSLARKLTFRMEEFSEITLDFANVPMIGQGFAHEVFVVFKHKYPKINILIKNANEDVQNMISHVINTKY